MGGCTRCRLGPSPPRSVNLSCLRDRAQGPQKYPTLCLTAAAGLCANSAVFVAVGVTLTFGSACGATVDTGLEKRVHEVAVPLELRDKDSSRQAARAGAVVVQPDALPQRINVRFTKASVGTSSAGELALDACLDAIFE